MIRTAAFRKVSPRRTRICCFAPRHDGTVLAAFATGFAVFDPTTGRRDEVAAVEADLPQTRLNDGRTDRQGRFIAGGMDEVDLKPISSVWRVDPDLTVTRLFGEVRCANSTCFSPDGKTMYFADSPEREIVAFEYDEQTGGVGARRVVASIPAGQGVPDGSCVDAEGFLWNAVWEGCRIDRYAPDGRLDMSIEVPTAKPTCVAFGGADLDTLFITSSRLGMSEEKLGRQPGAGSLFAVKPGVRGVADAPFSG
jgi:L-arabinonolactonase